MNKIISHLKKKKSLPLDKFIDLALYDKKFGYYIKKNPFGKNGDFITSPLISKLFGEMIAVWCVAFWEYLDKPKKIIVVELGPGDGSLCKDFIETSKKFKEFYKSIEINLLEKSNKLKEIQKNKVNNKKVRWINRIDEIKYGPIIFIGNEFFDSLPIKQIYKNKKKFYERYVSLTESNKKISFLNKKANKKLIEKVKKLDLISTGDIIEYPINAINYLEKISKKIIKYNGGLLVFDYGYIKQKNQDTLQSLQKHTYKDLFSNPGNADITSHVNYQLFTNILNNNNLEVEKVIKQSEFLQKMGIVERANILSKKITFKQKADMFFRLKKLLDYKEMGSLFKVMFAKRKNIKFNLGF